MTKCYVLSELAKEQLKEIYRQGYINFGEQQAENYFTALETAHLTVSLRDR